MEGPTDDPNIRQLRSRQSRALLSTLLLAHGVPLLLGGDEAGRSQQGNNNAYCQDNEIAWWDWSTQDADLREFTRDLIALRLAHPVLRRRNYPVHPDAQRFFTPAGAPMTATDWADAGAKSVALVLSGSVDPDLDDDGEPMLDDDLALLLNAWWKPLDFALPWTGDDHWTTASDSYRPNHQGQPVTGQTVSVGPRSLVVLLRSA